MVETKRTRQTSAGGKENQTSSQGTASGRGTKRNAKSNADSVNGSSAEAATTAPPAKTTKVDRASKSQSKTSNEPSTAASTVATRRSADSKATEKTLNDSSKSESSRAPTATNSGKQKAFNGLNQEVDRILGCTEHEGELVFLIKWKNSDDDPQVVPAKIANIKYPQKVIEFYEQRIIWDDPL